MAEAGAEAVAVAVSGAGGWIGRAVCETLRAQGHRVIALVRERSVEADVVRTLDLAEAPPEQLCADLAALRPRAFIHAAGHAHRPDTPEEASLFYRVNTEGTRHMLALAQAAAIPRFIHLSTLAVYDWTTSILPVAEGGQVSLTTAYSRSKHAAEECVSQAPLEGCNARLATVFGPGDPANFSRLARALARRRFLLPGDGAARKSVLPVALAARWLVELALLPKAPPQTINLALSEAPSLHEICEAFARLCGWPSPRSLPLPLLRSLAGVGDAVARVYPGMPLTRDTLRKLTTSTWVETRLAQTLLSAPPQQSFAEFLLLAREDYANLAA